MTLAQPFWLLLLLVLPLLMVLRRKQASKQHTAFIMPHGMPPGAGRTWRTWVHRQLPINRYIVLALLTLAMARPQQHWIEQKVEAEAVDIMLTMDISLSMLSRDFNPDRLSIAKQVAADFVEHRPYDRVGLVAFSAQAFTQCPLTTDKKVVTAFINDLKVGILEHGTAIGMGLATAVNRLRESASKSKVVILLTDGENNAGYISPQKATEMARVLGIRVYTIGIGTDGNVLTPEGQNPDGSYFFGYRYTKFDTQLLQEIARQTQGKFFRALTEKDLQSIYAEIDQLEKTKIQYNENYHTAELFIWPAGLALALLFLELLIRYLVARSVTV